ncbi:hypothetical protein ACN94_07125 [Gordonia paraffinivorans]|uniref:FAS1-like dehydratase domain-containing protein n=1 Tax=Gordonia paraffinivorans TaxID=175628 RepID=UPI001C92D488|nr:hypothetical protein [Gordonia paraffinivorans]
MGSAAIPDRPVAAVRRRRAVPCAPARRLRPGTGRAAVARRRTVEVGKVREFVRATHASDPVHTDPESAAAAGFAGIAATPTHVVVAGHHRGHRPDW